MNLKIQDRFVNASLTINHSELGQLNINTATLDPSQYQKYFDLGINIFEKVPAKVIEYQGIQEDFTKLSLSQLRKRFPTIQAKNKKQYLSIIYN